MLTFLEKIKYNKQCKTKYNLHEKQGFFHSNLLSEGSLFLCDGSVKKGTKYRILSEKTNEDGSIVMEIKKQYNTSPVGEYLSCQNQK